MSTIPQRTFRNRKGRPRQGAALVELAMCLPVLFLLLFGCYEFARVNMTRHAIQAAAYEGARKGIIPGATVAEVQQQVDFVLGTVGIRNAFVTVTPDPIPLRAETIRVQVSARPADNSVAPFLYTKAISLQGDCQLNRESGF